MPFINSNIIGEEEEKLIEEIRVFATDDLAYDANIAFDYNINIMQALINE